MPSIGPKNEKHGDERSASVSRFPQLVSLVLMLAFVWVELAAIPGEAPTVDEQNHLARGLSVLRTGDYRLLIGHPPLLNLIAALPLAFDPRIQLPLDDPVWRNADWIEFSISLLWKLNNPALAMIYAGRLMMVLLGVLTLAALYRLGADVVEPAEGGHWVGTLMIVCAVLDPNFRAHARLITTDIGIVLALALVLIVWRRWVRRPNPRLLVLAGLTLGVALGSKFSALVFAPLLLLIAAQTWGLTGATILRLSGALVISGLLVWALYLFELRPPVGWVFPIPLANFWEDFFFTTEVTHQPNYLLGQVNPTADSLYFPVALLVKMPVPLLIALLLGSGLGWRTWRAEPLLWLPALFYFLVAVLSGVNIGYRHLFPLLPTLYLAAALALLSWWRAHGPRRFLAVGALGWLAVNSALIYPRDLTFFNEVALGPDNGWRVLVDSNLDWGQDLGELAAFVRERNIDSIYVSYFGSVPIGSVAVSAYPIPARPLPPRPAPDWQPLFPQPGWYAISLTHLVGGASLANADTFAYFRHQQPEAVLGRTIYVYRVPEQTGTVAICVNPPPSVGAAEARRIFGAAQTRLIQYDCTRGLPLPAGRAWYLLRGEQVETVREPLEKLGATLQYDEPNNPDPRFTFRLYELEEAATRAVAYPTQPIAPQVFGERLAFLGHSYRVALKPGAPVEVQTAWRVVAPLTEPLSLFLHLSAPDGFPLAVSDGLNTPFDSLQPGDALIQFHPLEYPTELPPGAQFRVGAYTLSGAQSRYQLPDGADFVAWTP